MQTFPVLNSNQVALFRAEKKTGIILDEKFQYAINDEQSVYTIFDSFENAMLFAEKILASNGDVEIIIYSQKKDVLYYSNER